VDATSLVKIFEETPTEQLSPGIKYKWLFDRHILYVIGDTSHRSDIDAWFQFMCTVMGNWPDDITYLAVQDLSSPNFSLTPYARTRATEIYKVRPTLRGRVAIVMPRSFIGHLLQMFIRTVRGNIFDTRFFLSQGDALVWLAQKLPQ